MAFANGKNKALTLSYDDGITQDIRLIELMNKYGLKGTFNLNSELLGKSNILNRNGMRISHYKVSPADVRFIYEGHEVAAHTLTHPRLPGIAEDAEVIRQVEQDRLNLSELAGYEVVGMAYPCGGENNDARVARLIRENTGIKYARGLKTTGGFEPQPDLYRFLGTAYHLEGFDGLMELARRFVESKADTPQIFYLWGHSYEMDYEPDHWIRLEELFALLAGHEDIFYGTNREVLLG